jgi:catechol 2,3-dioxygenase-like lactoylglutathione lyase family enzyme
MPAALRSARGATFALMWSDGDADRETVEAALGVLGEFADRIKARRFNVLLVTDGRGTTERGGGGSVADLVRLAPSEISIYPVVGFDKRDAALKAAGVAGSPLLTYVEGAEPVAVAGGRPSEMFIVTEPEAWRRRRAALTAAGFTLTCGVELTGGKLVGLATMSAKSLEAFKSELWAVDDFEGVRIRDPGGHEIEITVEPNLHALKDELAGWVDGRTVTEIKTYVLTETVYRASDATRALHALLAEGVIRAANLKGDAVVSRAPAG